MKYKNIPKVNEYIEVLKMDKSPKTIETYIYAIEKLLGFTEISEFNKLKEITPIQIRSFQSKLKESISSSSINTVMRPLKAMFNWFIENNYTTINPFTVVKDLKTVKKVAEFLTQEEIAMIITSTKRFEDKLILSLLLTTGMRRNELITLKINNFNGTHIKIEGKGSKERVLVLQPEIADMLYMYIEWRNKRFGNGLPNIFISRYNKPYSGVGIWGKVKKSLRDAGLSEDRVKAIHTHSLRHTFTANILDVADIYTAKVALGHSKIETTMLYAHLRNSKLDSAMLNQKSIFS